MDSIKIHLGILSDSGAQNCDYRNEDGSERIGAAENDHHKTVFEIDPATPEEVAAVLKFGPQLNAMFSKSSVGGMFTGPRIGVWPGDGRK